MTSEGKPKTGSLIAKIILLLIIVAGIILAVLFAFQGDSISAFQWDKLDPMKLVEALKEEHNGIVESSFPVKELNIISTGVYMGNLILLTDSDIRAVNSKGEEIWYYTHEIRLPVLNINGKQVLVYEQTGKSYMVVRDGKVYLRDTLEEEIAFGEITEDKILFISLNETGYKRTVYAVSPQNGVQIGALYIDDYYPFFAKTTRDEENEFIVLNGLGMNSNRITTIIRLYKSTLETNPVTSIELEGLYPILFDAGQRKLFTGETGAYCYNQTLDLSWSKEFKTSLLAAGLFENGRTVLAMENSLLFCDENGKEIKNIPIDYKINSIEVYKNTAAVISDTHAAFYDASGNLTDNASLAGITLRVHFVDEKKAFMVSEHEAILHAISSRKIRN